MLEKFAADMFPLFCAALLGVAALGFVLALNYWNAKTEPGETIRKIDRPSVRAPVTQDPYPKQTPADCEIVLAQWYKYFGTPEEKQEAILTLKKHGIVYL